MRRIAFLAAFQVGVMLAWAGYHEHVWATAPTFRIPLRPVDPYDVLRGRYFILNPLDGSLKTGQPGVALSEDAVKRFLGAERAFGGPALVGFCPVEGKERACALAPLGAPAAESPARFWSRARVTVSWEAFTWREREKVLESGFRVGIDFGLDRFFIPNRATLPGRQNDPGWEVEVCHRRGLTLLPRRLWFRDQPVDLR